MPIRHAVVDVEEATNYTIREKVRDKSQHHLNDVKQQLGRKHSRDVCRH